MQKKKANLCLIGPGNFGSLLYSKADKSKLCSISYVYHPDIEKARRLDAAKGISDLRIALQDKNVDGVIIATPNDQHYKQIMQCLEAGKHVFVEKPVTAEYLDAVILSSYLENNTNLTLMVGHNHRRKAFVRKTKGFLDKKELGDLVSVDMNVSHGGIFGFVEGDWRTSKEKHPEGPLMTVGIHLIDTLHYLFGPVKSAYAMIKNVSKKAHAPDCNSVLLEMENGTMVHLQANYNMPSEERYIFNGTEGIVYVDRDRMSLRKGRDSRINGNFEHSKPNKIKLVDVDTYKEELDEFCNAILKGSKIETGIKQGLDALTVIDACRQSDAAKKAIFMNQYRAYF